MWEVEIPRYAKVVFQWMIQGRPVEIRASSAHNLFLDIGSSSGIPALLILLLITITTAVRFYRLSGLLEGEAQILVTGLLWGFVGLLIMGFYPPVVALPPPSNCIIQQLW